MNRKLREKMYLHIRELGRTAGSIELTDLLGIRCPAAEIAQRIIQGIVNDDKRFKCDEQMGWSLSEVSELAVQTHQPYHVDCSFTAEEYQSVVVTFDFRPNHFSPSSTIHKLAAQKIDGSRRSDCFGPFVIEYNSAERIMDSATDVPILPFRSMVREFLSFCGDRFLVVWRSMLGIQHLNLLATCEGLDSFYPIVVPLSKIAELLYPDRRTRRLDEFLEDMGWRGYSPEAIIYHLEVLVDLTLDFQERVRNEEQIGLNEWFLQQTFLKQTFDFGRVDFDQNFLEELPSSPGVYKMFDREGDLLYIGKSQNLKQRVNSYFLLSDQNDEKIKTIHDRLSRIDIIQPGSELAAEILEASLILKHRPPLNVKMEFNASLKEPAKNCFLILPSRESQIREVHIVNSRGNYCVLLIADDNDNLSLTVTTMVDFFEHDTLPGDQDFILLDETMRSYAALIVRRWWVRHRNIIPLYEYAHLSSGDIERILEATLSDSFSATTFYR